MMMHYPSHLSELGEHDHDGGVVFPQHSPEVLRGLGQRALGGYVRPLLPANRKDKKIIGITSILQNHSFYFCCRVESLSTAVLLHCILLG